MWACYDAFEGFDLYFVNVRGTGNHLWLPGLGAVQDVVLFVLFPSWIRVILVGHSWEKSTKKYTYRHRVLSHGR